MRGVYDLPPPNHDGEDSRTGNGVCIAHSVAGFGERSPLVGAGCDNRPDRNGKPSGRKQKQGEEEHQE